jgi:hypothetical protein
MVAIARLCRRKIRFSRLLVHLAGGVDKASMP